MNNQWRDNANLMVVWADGTYDSVRHCTYCSDPSCKTPEHKDSYKVIGNDRDMTDAQEDEFNPKDYWSWMLTHRPLGGSYDSDGEFMANEFWAANPDGGLCEHNQIVRKCDLCVQEPGQVARHSGVTEQQYDLMQKAFSLLTDKQKQVWQLVMREQLSETEVAKQLKISQPMVNKHLKYAKAKVTEFLRGGTDVSA